jgi:hypothetical protein
MVQFTHLAHLNLVRSGTCLLARLVSASHRQWQLGDMQILPWIQVFRCFLLLLPDLWVQLQRYTVSNNPSAHWRCLGLCECHVVAIKAWNDNSMMHILTGSKYIQLRGPTISNLTTPTCETIRPARVVVCTKLEHLHLTISTLASNLDSFLIPIRGPLWYSKCHVFRNNFNGPM